MDTDVPSDKSSLDQALLDVLGRLEKISRLHKEIFDSEVRDNMAMTVFHGFLKPDNGFTLPTDFGMSSAKGNQLVRDALGNYIEKASDLAAAQGLNFYDRLAAFQKYNVKIDSSNLAYDSFFGHFVAKYFDETGSQI